jgi:hypothetical protein
MNEHRAAPGHRILKAGTISFGGGTIDCAVRNLSETGAALEVVTPLFIPDRFTPIVQSEQLKGPCHIVWRKEKRMGVAFDRWRPVPNRSHRRRRRSAKTKAKVRRTDPSPARN